MADDPLSLDPGEMRRVGYRAVDALVEATTRWEMPPIRRADPGSMRALLRHPPPEGPLGSEAALDSLFADVLPYLARLDHPRYFAFIPCSGTWPGAIGDFVASALNLYAASWLEGAGLTELELTVIDWFRTWIGYPEGAEGQLTSGGSVANLQAIACAREHMAGSMRDDLVLYASDQAHSSVARAARVLGFRPGQVRVLPTDRSFRLHAETLAAAIDVDRRRGLTPLVASVNAGATSTGAVDPLQDLGEVCRERGVWLHADAAYGGFAMLVERGRAALGGLASADSVTLDPHKWLYQSYECGSLLVREPEALRRAFEVVPPYLRDIHADPGQINLSDRGIQLSRTSRALKVWLSIQSLGLASFRAAIDRSFDHAEHAAARLERSDRFELMAPPGLGIVCFRRRLPGVDDEQELARHNAVLLGALERSGRGFISSTTLRGRYALRLCPMNHATTIAHIDDALDFLETFEPGTARAPSETAAVTRDEPVSRTWLRRQVGEAAPATMAMLRAVPLLHDLDAGALDAATVLDVEPGATIVREWDLSRDFYVVLDGAVRVERDGEEVARLERGAFFGELAALDWGSGYGYARTATVHADGRVRLLVFAEGALPSLMRSAPALRAAVEAAAGARLPG